MKETDKICRSLGITQDAKFFNTQVETALQMEPDICLSLKDSEGTPWEKFSALHSLIFRETPEQKFPDTNEAKSAELKDIREQVEQFVGTKKELPKNTVEWLARMILFLNNEDFK